MHHLWGDPLIAQDSGVAGIPVSCGGFLHSASYGMQLVGEHQCRNEQKIVPASGGKN